MAKDMTFEEFKTEVIENIKAYLPTDYEDAELSVETINKAGVRYEGLLIRLDTPSMSCTPVLNLSRAYFDEYTHGRPLESILEEFARVRVTAAKKLPIKKEDFLDYNKIKDRIVPKLVNTENNMKYLANKAIITMEDLSIVFVVRTIEKDGIADAAITHDLLNLWKVTLAEVKEQAIKNFETSPFKFENLLDAMLHQNTPDIEDIDLDEYEVPVFIVSNEQNTQGAGMVLNPYLMNRVIEKLGDVYIVPSSVDEVLVLPKNAGPALNDLINMVTSVNTESVKPEDRLSNNIYEYDKETNLLRLAKV